MLVVDDHDEVAMTVAELVKKNCYEADFVTSGEQDLNYLDRHPVDLVVTDLVMSEVDG